jgi:hypothetical protein
VVNANHGGRMRVSICPYRYDDPRANQACFDNPAHILRRVSTNATLNNKIYWYLSKFDEPTERDNGFRATTQRFRLPAGISCDNGCMMQW